MVEYVFMLSLILVAAFHGIKLVGTSSGPVQNESRVAPIPHLHERS